MYDRRAASQLQSFDFNVDNSLDSLWVFRKLVWLTKFQTSPSLYKCLGGHRVKCNLSVTLYAVQTVSHRMPLMTFFGSFTGRFFVFPHRETLCPICTKNSNRSPLRKNTTKHFQVLGFTLPHRELCNIKPHPMLTLSSACLRRIIINEKLICLLISEFSTQINMKIWE